MAVVKYEVKVTSDPQVSPQSNDKGLLLPLEDGRFTGTAWLDAETGEMLRQESEGTLRVNLLLAQGDGKPPLPSGKQMVRHTKSSSRSISLAQREKERQDARKQIEDGKAK